MDLDQIQKTIDKFYSHIFSQKDIMEILEEIASNKINEDKKHRKRFKKKQKELHKRR